MALKTYIGARYAPKFMGKWNNTTAYEPLSVVYWNNNSYVSKGNVPAGTPVTVEEPDGEVVTNSAYWILSSDWNAQVAQYQATVEQYRDEAVKQTAATNQYRKDTQNFFEVTMHSYNTEEEMKNDSTVKVGYTLVTCGKRSIGDGGGKYFKVVEETSSDAIAIAGGLWAKPFNITSPEEGWTELDLTLDESNELTIASMISGGRYITNIISLQSDVPQYGISIANASELNNVQLILRFRNAPDGYFKFVFSPDLGSANILASQSHIEILAKIDNGVLTLSTNNETSVHYEWNAIATNTDDSTQVTKGTLRITDGRYSTVVDAKNKTLWLVLPSEVSINDAIVNLTIKNLKNEEAKAGNITVVRNNVKLCSTYCDPTYSNDAKVTIYINHDVPRIVPDIYPFVPLYYKNSTEIITTIGTVSETTVNVNVNLKECSTYTEVKVNVLGQLPAQVTKININIKSSEQRASFLTFVFLPNITLADGCQTVLKFENKEFSTTGDPTMFLLLCAKGLNNHLFKII